MRLKVVSRLVLFATALVGRIGARAALAAAGALAPVALMAAPSWATKGGHSANAKLCEAGAYRGSSSRWRELLGGRGIALLAGVVLALAASGASASALPLGEAHDFPNPTGGFAGFPSQVAVGPEGHIWFTEAGPSKIAEINPTTHESHDFATPTSTEPEGIAVGPEGNLWFTERPASKIGEINPTTHAINEFETPTPSSDPWGVALGPEGNLWFTEFEAGKIGEINPTTHVISEVATPGGEPFGIAVGPEGNLWFAERSAGKIGEINPTTHETHEFAIPTAESGPSQIALGPEGNLWFTEPGFYINSGVSKVGEINPTTHAISDFATPTANSNPEGIAVGPEGHVWFTEWGASKIGEINPATHEISEFATPNGFETESIVLAPEGNLWFSEPWANSTGVIGANAQPASLAAPVVAGSGQAGTQQVCEGELWSNFAGQQPSLEALSFDGYQWLLDGAPLVGETAQAFTPSAGQLGHALSCRVTATYPLTHTTAVATSAPVSVIAQSSGPTGAYGAIGAQGPAGPAGRTGPAGPAGKVELVKCTTVTKKVKGKKKTSQNCSTSFVSGPVSFTTSAAALKATLSRHGRVAATGTLRTVAGHIEFLSGSARALRPGRYTLTVKRTTGTRLIMSRQTITIT